MDIYKGKGNHSVQELEELIEQREEKINLIKRNIESYSYWLDRYGVNQMRLQKQQFKTLTENL